MYPPIFPVVAGSTAVKALIGASPVRFYLFGQAPQGVAKPYAVWRQVGGTPENYLGDLPDIDSFTTQIDIYAADATGERADKARAVAKAIRDAIEPHAYVTAWIGDSRDPDTLNYVYTFQVDWLTPR